MKRKVETKGLVLSFYLNPNLCSLLTTVINQWNINYFFSFIWGVCLLKNANIKNIINACYQDKIKPVFLDPLSDKLFCEHKYPNQYFARVKEVVCTVDSMQAVIYWLSVGFLSFSMQSQSQLWSIWSSFDLEAKSDVLRENFSQCFKLIQLRFSVILS